MPAPGVADKPTAMMGIEFAEMLGYSAFKKPFFSMSGHEVFSAMTGVVKALAQPQ